MTKYDRDAYDNCVQFYCYNKVRFGRQFLSIGNNTYFCEISYMFDTREDLKK